MNFSVRNPQLEYSPGQYPEGLRRFNFNKNQNSFDYPSNNPIPDKNSPQIESKYQTQHSELQKLKLQLQTRQQELNRLKELAEGNIKSFSPSPLRLRYPDLEHSRSSVKPIRSSNEYSIFDIAKHPAFQQPKYTKNNPKVVPTNVINGYSNFESSLGHYGKLINGLLIMFLSYDHLLFKKCIIYKLTLLKAYLLKIDIDLSKVLIVYLQILYLIKFFILIMCLDLLFFF
ncbi:hypothetical protein SteCoe_4602 [Stentor coeruleus]|uniref:Uncharacterized protein n=1 Tax=Stentor coeruleus TaxID=5963 RepID=A0A1R2CUC3_9CILI|nr:hypothetical protein SteCoe_4602 [Stentor coeruleus]